MSEPNYAGSIIVNLASLPEFLRKPILTRRMLEFFRMDQQEKDEVILNALAAGPGIPFPNFSRLLKTWLEILATFSEERRSEIFSRYMLHICKDPGRIVGFYLEGILEVYESLSDAERHAVSGTIRKILGSLDTESQRRIMLVIPSRSSLILGL